MTASSHCCLPHTCPCAREICVEPESLLERSFPVPAGHSLHNALSHVTVEATQSLLWHHTQYVLFCDITKRTNCTVTWQTRCAMHRWGVGPGTGELRTVHPSLVMQGGRERTRNTSVDSTEQFKVDRLSDCQQGQLFPHKPVICLRVTAFLTHSPRDFSQKSLAKIKGVLLGQGEVMSHQHATAGTGCWLSQWQITWVKEWSSSPIKSLRIILMLRKWSVSYKFNSYETVLIPLIQVSTTDVMGVHLKAEPGSPAMIIINRITFGAITELHECSVLEDLQKTSFLIKKIGREAYSPLKLPLKTTITCGCNSSVSDRNKPGVTSQKTMEFLQWKTLLALVSTLCSLLYRSRSHIDEFKEGIDVPTGWLPNVIPDVLCFLTNDYYKIMDMFPDHTPWAGKPIDGPFPSKGQIRCQGAFLNRGDE